MIGCKENWNHHKCIQDKVHGHWIAHTTWERGKIKFGVYTFEKVDPYKTLGEL